ncbi:hypothetical protein [Terrabacter terrigena]|uniref:Uncharacterized protein n=1 Tax=Terrabacter terrigena TaxID=574718 RepID=A0ABW3MXR9_9MICO
MSDTYDEYEQYDDDAPSSGSLEDIVQAAVMAALQQAGSGTTLDHNAIAASARRQAIAAASGQSAVSEQSVAVAVRALEKKEAAGEALDFDAVADAIAASGAEVIRDRRSTGRR